MAWLATFLLTFGGVLLGLSVLGALWAFARRVISRRRTDLPEVLRAAGFDRKYAHQPFEGVVDGVVVCVDFRDGAMGTTGARASLFDPIENAYAGVEMRRVTAITDPATISASHTGDAAFDGRIAVVAPANTAPALLHRDARRALIRALEFGAFRVRQGVIEIDPVERDDQVLEAVRVVSALARALALETSLEDRLVAIVDDDEEPDALRVRALGALGAGNPPGEAALALARRHSESRNDVVRLAAARLLLVVDSGPLRAIALDRAVDPNLRASAIRQLRGTTSVSNLLLAQLLDDAQGPVVLEAISMVTEQRIGEFVDRLRTRLDEDSSVAVAAAEALAELGDSEAAAAMVPLLARLRDDEARFERVADAIGAVGKLGVLAELRSVELAAMAVRQRRAWNAAIDAIVAREGDPANGRLTLIDGHSGAGHLSIAEDAAQRRAAQER